MSLRRKAGGAESSDGDDAVPATSTGQGGRQTGTPAQTPEQTKTAESKSSKMKTRLKFGTPLIFGFFVLVYLGHPYMVLLVCVLQVGLFRELVNVRYEPAKEKMVPLFRTLQWAMFAIAMLHVYGCVFVQLGLAQSAVERLPYFLSDVVGGSIRYLGLVTFSCYVAVFVGFVLSLRRETLKYQIGNLVWTVGVLALVVWQIMGTTELIFAGLCWFMLPCSLVVANDCFAYFCGLAMCHRFIKAPFLALSPNKTWEGFIGAFPCTVIWAWLFSDWITRSTWLMCPQHNVDVFGSEHLFCVPAPEFVVQPLVASIQGITLFTVNAKPFQLHACILAAFASVVAPFGGFFASAIKRAYNLKDFDSLIPGHGGFMDRMDCQFLMLLCTNVHYRTFFPANLQEFSEQEIIRAVGQMLPEVRSKFLERLVGEFSCTGSCT